MLRLEGMEEALPRDLVVKQLYPVSIAWEPPFTMMVDLVGHGDPQVPLYPPSPPTTLQVPSCVTGDAMGQKLTLLQLKQQNCSCYMAYMTDKQQHGDDVLLKRRCAMLAGWGRCCCRTDCMGNLATLHGADKRPHCGSCARRLAGRTRC